MRTLLREIHGFPLLFGGPSSGWSSDRNVVLFCVPSYSIGFAFNFLDVDECSASVPVCDVNADCMNTLGSHRCTCKAGFIGDGKTCTGKRSAEYSVI